VNHSSVRKATSFFQSCYESSTKEEDLDNSEMMRQFVESVNFSDSTNASWNAESIGGFQESLAWLTARKWNYLFQIDTFESYQLFVQQNFRFWLVCLYVTLCLSEYLLTFVC